MCRLLIAGALGAAMLLSPVLASAVEAAPLSSQQRREAKRLFDRGELAYRKGDYEEAILHWQESYAISHHPLTFEAISNAHEKLGDYRAALDNLKRWRKHAPADEHEVLDARIANYTRKLAEQEQAEAARDAERQRLEEAAKRAEEQRERDAATLDPRTIAGFALLGSGGAAIITGVVLDVVAAGKRPDVADTCRERQQLLLCLASERDTITDANTLAIVGDSLWIGGIAFAGTGAALVVLSALDDDTEPAVPATAGALFLPLVTPTTVGMSVSGTF